MIRASSTDIWEMMVPYIKKECWKIVDCYVKEKTKEYQLQLREILEPKLEELSVDVIKTMGTFGSKSEVVLRLTLVGDKEKE